MSPKQPEVDTDGRGGINYMPTSTTPPDEFPPFNNFTHLDFNNNNNNHNDMKLISDKDFYAANIVINCCLCLVVSFIGVLSNLVNLRVFVKQGFVDSINISFASLAVADLIGVTSMLWRSILFVLQELEVPSPVDFVPFVHLTAGWPHVYGLKTGGWITAFITFHRCLCIAMPLKIKSLITPRKVLFIHVAIYTLALASIAPLYYTNQFAWKFYPDRNRTLLGVVHPENRYEIEGVVFPITGHFLTIGALVVNIVCIVILVVKLVLQNRWRQAQASTGISSGGGGGGGGGGTDSSSKKLENVNAKETRIIKLTVAIATIYMICFLPHLSSFYWMAVDQEIRLDGKRKNFFIVVISLAGLIEIINSSINIIIYYNMSSKYKSTLLELFTLKHRDSDPKKIAL